MTWRDNIPEWEGTAARVDPPQRDQLPPMSHCKFHHTACGRHFTSLVAFDRHLIDGECHDPTTRGLSSSSAGVCQISGQGRVEPVEVWAIPMTDKERARLAELAQKGKR